MPKALWLCVCQRTQGESSSMTPSRRSISDHPSAVLPKGGREGEKKKIKKFVWLGTICRAWFTSPGRTGNIDPKAARDGWVWEPATLLRNIMWQTENIVGRDARHNRGRNRVETLSKHLNEVVKEQIADEEEGWSRGDSVQITLSQWKNESLNQTN